MVSLAQTKHSKSEEAFAPVGFDPKTYVAKRSAKDPEFKQAYAALEDEFSALDALLHARHAAGLTQAEVAGRMGINPSSLARIEGSLGSHKHSPSLATLRKYAQACGMHLTINLA
jgi:DNA-binding XRE family transcriptional regulator